MLDQAVDIFRVAREQADANAGADKELVAGADKRATKQRQQLIGHCGGVAVTRQLGQQDDELVAAMSGYRVYLAQYRTQAFADQLQQAVADRMAEAVVDLLEAV